MRPKARQIALQYTKAPQDTPQSPRAHKQRAHDSTEHAKQCLKEKKKTKLDTSHARDSSDKSAAKQRKRARCEAVQRSEAAQRLSTEQMAKSN
jgi:hypothetical protein